MNLHVLNEFKKKRSLKYSDMEKMCGVNQRTLQKVFTGEKEPSLKTLRAVCDMFGICPSVIVQEESESSYTWEDKHVIKMFKRLDTCERVCIMELLKQMTKGE